MSHLSNKITFLIEQLEPMEIETDHQKTDRQQNVQKDKKDFFFNWTVRTGFGRGTDRTKYPRCQYLLPVFLLFRIKKNFNNLCYIWIQCLSNVAPLKYEYSKL